MAFWHSFVRVSGVQRVEKAWSLHEAIRRELDMVDGECEQRAEDLAEILEQIVQAKVSGLRTLRRSTQLLDRLKIDPLRVRVEDLGSLELGRKLVASAESFLDAPADRRAITSLQVAVWALVDRGPASGNAPGTEVPEPIRKRVLPGSAPAVGTVLGLMIRALVPIETNEDAAEQITVRALVAIEQRRAIISALKGIDIFCRDYQRNITQAAKELEGRYLRVETALMPHGMLSHLQRRLQLKVRPERLEDELHLILPLIQAGAKFAEVMKVPMLDLEGNLLKPVG